MLAEEPIPGGYLEDSMEAPRAVGEQQSSVEVPATHFTATEDQSHQDEFEEAQDDSSPFTACSRRGRKSSRKRPRLSRKQVKDEVTEQIPGVTSEAAAEAAGAAAGAGMSNAMNHTTGGAPAPAYAPYTSHHQPFMSNTSGGVIGHVDPSGPPAMHQGLQPRVLPFTEAVGPPSAPYPTPQGVCMQNAQWLPLQQKNEPMELRGPIGAAEGPPTEAESDGLIKQDLSASPIEGLTGGAPVDAADTSQSPSAASASACGISTFAAAESYAGAPSLSFDEPSVLQLDSSPKLAVEGGPAGPPVGHPPGPGMPHMRPRVASTGPPPLEWIGG
ncbi:hypothetical protein cyc_04580 [Cyclospora cayetanensis]|uniref:Uncharacterized protein n=1 Tax=Cyclospora cayetanensis TaxID=88456 RepID=A0A1D3CU18_9EIME|nr:hypothetical protein cyc_04580 [Cyclospora cayetanensis]